MAEVALQAYENEIDQMIEEARYLEALAHLRHILSKYPRYLGAYYLLGKMLLEADLPELAVDMFRRVLNADPEHFLARIGLGLAHDHLGKPEAAIWNLEQAFELASGDDAIHDELRRLIGQRDGVTPDHIPMSRTGLARLYLRGNLFNRAVEELRNLVTAHPERADLQVALTEAYWRDDQIVLAAENCQKILDAFPYNLKANLLLGTLLQSSGQEGSTRYLQRAQEVDPENRMAEALFGANGPLPAKPKPIERLVYDPEALDVDQKARWFRNLEAASVSVGISETMPQMTDAEMRLVDVTADLESQIEIPEWLRDLSSEEDGEVESVEWLGEESETPEDIVGYDELASWLEPEKAEPPAATAEDSDIPDWLQGLQPPEVEAALEPAGDEEVPEWLRSMQPAESEIIPLRPSDDLQADETLPDWLAELRPPASEAAGIAAEQEPTDEELPEWLREAMPAASAPESEPPEAEDTDLGWLQNLEASAPDFAETSATEATESEDMFGWEAFSGHETESPTSGIAEEAEGAEPLPDWLAELAPPAAAAGAVAAGAEDTEELEELPEWLAELKPSAAEAESETAAEEALEPLPDWLAEMELPAAEEAEIATGATEADEMFGWSSFPESETAATEAVAEAEEELPEWLAELKPPVVEMEAAAIAATAAEEEELEELPEWLAELKPPVAEAEAGIDAQAAAGAAEEALEPLPDWLAEMELPAAEEAEIATGATETDEMFGWSSFPESETAAAEAVTEAEEELPEWLAELKPPVAGVEAAAIAAATAEEEELEELPEWLAELKPPVAEVEAVAIAAATAEEEELEELPEWLAELKPPVAEAEAGIAAQAAAGAAEEALEPLPDWLAEMEPPAAEEAEIATGATETDEMFGWSSFPESETAAAEAVTEAEEELPEWLAELKPPVAEVEAAAIAAATAEEEELEELPEWLAELKPPEAPAPGEGIALPAEEPAIPAPEGEMMSGDDALAWLASLAAGKEDELRAQAEAETRARVDEIMGRKPTAPLPTVEPEVPEAVSAEPPITEPAIAEAPAPGEGIALPAEEPAIPALEGEMMSGDDALAWLASLAAGKEDELRAQAEAETRARVDEIMGRKPTAPLPTVEPEVPEAVSAEPLITEPATAEAPAPGEGIALPAEEPAMPTLEGEMMSGDDALAWLASLAAGKEDELRAQAETETRARVDEIMGRKPTAPLPSLEPEAPAPVAEEPVATVPVVAEPVIEEPVVTEAPAAPAPEDEMMSGDDALAWLASLAAGKEDELRAQAEAETRARVDEIMGRKPTAPLPSLEPEAPAPVAEEPVATVPVVAEPAVEKPVVAEAPAAPAPKDEMMSGDDALAWLASLAAGKEDELRAQAEAETRARVDEIMGRKPTAPLPSLEPETPAPVVEEPGVAEAPTLDEGAALKAEDLEPIAEEMAAIVPAVAEEIPAIAEIAEEGDFFGWSGFEPEVAEAETAPEPEILESETLTPTSFIHPGPDSQEPLDQKPEEVKIAEPVLAEPEPSTVTEVVPPAATPAPAVDALRARVQADPKDYPSRLELARALVSQDAIQEAIEHYGRLVRERQSLADIETDLTQMLEQQPNDPRPLQTLGDLNMQNGRLDKAMEFYKRALSQL